MSNIKSSAGNVVKTCDDNPPGGGSLHLMVGMFLGSVHKTPGTEVADDRDSTYLSGAEYSGTPTENMYG